MSTEIRNDSSTNQCPIHQQSWGHRKTARPHEMASSPVECDEYGMWHINGFKEARTVLRSSSTRQASFGADLFDKTIIFRSFAYMDGKEHQQYRKQTARFFTPKVVNSASYQTLIEQQVDQLIATIRRKKQIDLGQCSLSLTVSVLRKLLGLNQSRLPDLQGRLQRTINLQPDMKPRYGALEKGKGNKLRWHPLQIIEIQLCLLQIYWLDVRPAIQAHRHQPEDDLISYLLTQNYSDLRILTECITFVAAGVQAMCEFICAAAWHLLEQPELKAYYLAASDEERNVLLQEISRLESPMERLYRRATEDITLYIETTNTQVTIPAGALIIIHLYHANGDESVVGEEPLTICPARRLKETGVSNAVMSFGDGAHSCPGQYIALREADIFLYRLLSLEGLHIVKQPKLSWNDFLTTYMLHDFIIGIA